MWYQGEGFHKLLVHNNLTGLHNNLYTTLNPCVILTHCNQKNLSTEIPGHQETTSALRFFLVRHPLLLQKTLEPWASGAMRPALHFSENVLGRSILDQLVVLLGVLHVSLFSGRVLVMKIPLRDVVQFANPLLYFAYQRLHFPLGPILFVCHQYPRVWSVYHNI
jgi:hypothetical protein